MSTQQERVVKLLNSRKITPYRLSKETGITQSTLSRFLNSPEGKVEMYPETMERIAKYFEVSSSWLLTGEGEMLKDESISQNAYGDNNQIAGRDINNNGVRGNTTTTNNTTNNYKDCGACETSLLEKAIDEMGEQRKLFAEQINRLLTIIEKMNDR